MSCTAAAHHVRHVDNFEARSIHRYEECRQSVVLAGLRVGNSDYICEFAAVGMGDQGLLTI